MKLKLEAKEESDKAHALSARKLNVVLLLEEGGYMNKAIITITITTTLVVSLTLYIQALRAAVDKAKTLEEVCKESLSCNNM